MDFLLRICLHLRLNHRIVNKYEFMVHNSLNDASFIGAISRSVAEISKSTEN